MCHTTQVVALFQRKLNHGQLFQTIFCWHKDTALCCEKCLCTNAKKPERLSCVCSCAWSQYFAMQQLSCAACHLPSQPSPGQTHTAKASIRLSLAEELANSNQHSARHEGTASISCDHHPSPLAMLARKDTSIIPSGLPGVPGGV